MVREVDVLRRGKYLVWTLQGLRSSHRHSCYKGAKAQIFAQVYGGPYNNHQLTPCQDPDNRVSPKCQGYVGVLVAAISHPPTGTTGFTQML